MIVETYRVELFLADATGAKRLLVRPIVTLYDPDGLTVWKGESWHVANRLCACSAALGKPPWLPPLELSISLARMVGGEKMYSVCLENN